MLKPYFDVAKYQNLITTARLTITRHHSTGFRINPRRTGQKQSTGIFIQTESEMWYFLLVISDYNISVSLLLSMKASFNQNVYTPSVTAPVNTEYLGHRKRGHKLCFLTLYYLIYGTNNSTWLDKIIGVRQCLTMVM